MANAILNFHFDYWDPSLSPSNFLVCDQLLEDLPLVEAFLCVPGKLTPGLDANHRLRRNIHSEDQQFWREKTVIYINV